MTSDKSYLPSNWNDDVRMNAMFSDFRNRNVNPNDWDAKLHFWRHHICEWCRIKNHLTFSTSQLRRSFSRNGRIPRGLETVLSEMLKDGQLMTVSNFLEATSDAGWMSWSLNILVRKPLSYSWSLIRQSLWATAQEETNQEYVNIDIIKEKSQQILQRHQTLVHTGDENSTITLEVLADHCKDICESVKDLELCILWLRKEKKLIIYNDQQHKIIKFVGDGRENPELSESDKALVQLKVVKKSLLHQIEVQESEIEKFKNEARIHLKQGARMLAKAALQKKKQAEKVLYKKEQTLENIENLLHRLQDVDTQKAVVDALRAGSDAFKLQGGLDIDKVDETMAAVQETLEAQAELEETLGKSIQPEYDLGELENELEDILSQHTEDESQDVITEEISHKPSIKYPVADMPAFPELPEIPTDSPCSLSDARVTELHEV